jgi:hypothetical protein
MIKQLAKYNQGTNTVREANDNNGIKKEKEMDIKLKMSRG